MDRLLVRSAATLSVTFTDGTNPINVSPVTVRVTRADGTVVLPAGTATTTPSTGVYNVVVPAASNTVLDTLTADWTGVLSAQAVALTTITEIVGGSHFSISAFRSSYPIFADPTAYPTDQLATARLYAETLIEEACGRAFVPRYALERVAAAGRWLPLAHPDVSAVRSLSTATYTYTPADAAAVVVTADSVLAPYGPGWITVGYEYGMPVCPADVSRASMLLARSYLLSDAQAGGGGSLDERATSITYADAGLTYGLVTSGVRGAPTNLPEVNSVVSRYQLAAIA